MRNQEEDKVVADLDREISRTGGLVGLVVCFGLSGWMALIAVLNVAAGV
jgi:type IV secretory pathway TrbD component